MFIPRIILKSDFKEEVKRTLNYNNYQLTSESFPVLGKLNIDSTYIWEGENEVLHMCKCSTPMFAG